MAVVVVVLLVHYLFTLGRAEPYPSIVMPGFRSVEAIPDMDEVLVRTLRVDLGDSLVLVTHDELFASAPIGQRSRMLARMDGLSGTPEEWAFLDDAAARLGLDGSVTAVEVVLLSASGVERSIVRVERGTS